MAFEIVCAVLQTPSERLAFEVRGDNDTNPGLWGLFGGGVRPGESAGEAIRREIREETTLAAEALALRWLGLRTIPAAVTGRDELQCAVFRGDLPDESLTVREFGDAAGVAFASHAEALAGDRLTPVARYILTCMERTYGTEHN